MNTLYISLTSPKPVGAAALKGLETLLAGTPFTVRSMTFDNGEPTPLVHVETATPAAAPTTAPVETIETAAPPAVDPDAAAKKAASAAKRKENKAKKDAAAAAAKQLADAKAAEAALLGGDVEYEDVDVEPKTADDLAVSVKGAINKRGIPIPVVMAVFEEFGAKDIPTFTKTGKPFEDIIIKVEALTAGGE